jgi:hypothetical protein
MWDWIFGSLCHSEDTESLTLGVKSENDQKTHGIINLYFGPLIEINSLIKIKLKKIISSFSL